MAAEHLVVGGVGSVMVFSDDPASSCAWWAGVLGLRVSSAQSGFCWLETAGGVELGFHPVDSAKNPRGASTVAYWRVDALDAALEAVVNAGAVRHRGPLQVSPGRRIAQVRDPFGVVMGLEGP